MLYKIISFKFPKYLHNIIILSNHRHNTSSRNLLKIFYCRTFSFKYSFFSYTISKWNNPQWGIHHLNPLLVFKNALLMVTTPSRKSVYNIHNPVGAKILSRLRLGLSQLTKHKFDNNFEIILNPTFSCCLPHEFVSHFSLYCLHSRDNRRSLFNELEKADMDNLGLPDNEITLYFFYMNILIIMQNSNSKIW